VLLVTPRNQTIFHAVAPVNGVGDPMALLAIACIATAIWFAWSVRRTAGATAFGALWFLLLLGPGAVLTTLGVGEPMAEHRVYLASCGVFLAASGGSVRLREWSERAGGVSRALAPALLALVAVGLGVQTVARNAVWHSPVTLWRESVDLAPDHYRPHLLLGEALQDDGRRDEAMEEFKAAIQLRPKDPTGYNKLGALFAALGRTIEARDTFSRALDLDPRNEQERRALNIIDRAEPRHGLGGAHRGRRASRCAAARARDGTCRPGVDTRPYRVQGALSRHARRVRLGAAQAARHVRRPDERVLVLVRDQPEVQARSDRG